MPIDGGVALSAALQVVFDRLCSRPVLEFFGRNAIIIDLLTKLRLKLLSANEVLNGAEEKQIFNRSVRMMLDELKDLIYAGEDLTERVNGEADLRRRVEDGSGSIRNFLRKLIPSPINTFDLTLKADLDDLLRKLEFTLSCLERVPNVFLPDLVAPNLGSSSVYGREADANAIVDLLLSDDVTEGQIPVISILGMVGVGKSTVLQLVYHCDTVVQHFNVKIWVDGSGKFDVTKIAKKFLGKLTPGRCAIEDDDRQNINLVKEGLRKKKVLFVIDDVCEVNYRNWESLKSIFIYAERGSKIVIATSDKNVAMMMDRGPTHHLHLLSKDDCWSLLCEHVSGIVDAGESPEPYATILYQRSRGLPLAVKLFIELIRAKAMLKDWRILLKNDIRWFQDNDKNSFVSQFWLCYCRLPHHLKDCFSYLSVFPRDYEFEKEDVILLWIAEGLLLREENTSLEEIGEEYFSALLSRSLLQQSSGSNSTFTVHPIMHELITFVSSQFCCRLDGTDSSNMTSKTRHLSLRKDEHVDFKKLKDFDKVKYLRTLLALPLPKSGDSLRPLDYKIPHEPLRAGYLRVLSLSQSSITKLPDWFRFLKQLRYLDLSSSKIREISDDIFNLVNLMILLLSNCKDLVELPTDMGNLVNLWHVDIRGTPLQRMPLRVGCSKGLRTLTNFVVSKDRGSQISELRELQHMCGEVEISNLQNISDANDALGANFREKKFIRVLSFEWYGGGTLDTQQQEQVLYNLQPHSDLGKLSISGYGGRTFPDWMTDNSLCRIVELCLLHCRNCCFLPPFQHLRTLKWLEIDGFDNLNEVDHQPYVDIAFKCLEILKFSNMPSLNLWSHAPSNAASGLFPRLQELHLQNCPQLNVRLCGCFPSLKTLNIQECRQLLPLEPMAGQINSAFPSLQIVLISECPEQELFLGGGLPSSINTLSISGCGMLRALESRFYELVSLTELKLDGCNELQRLPPEGLPDCLSSLYINNCSLLRGRCQRDRGEDWSKISSISRLVIDNYAI